VQANPVYVDDSPAAADTLARLKDHLAAGNLDEAVRVLQSAVEHVRHDFHVFVPVPPEALTARDAVLVDDAETPKPHVRRIVVIRERERELGFEPAMVGAAACVGFANEDFHF
jgi:hypothetical protein